MILPIILGILGVFLTFGMTYFKTCSTDLGSNFYFYTNSVANALGATLCMFIIGAPIINVTSLTLISLFIFFYVKVSDERIGSFIEVIKSDPLPLLMGMSIMTICLGYIWDFKIPQTTNVLMLVIAIIMTTLFVSISECPRNDLYKSYFYALIIKVFLIMLTFYKLGAVALFISSFIIMIKESDCSNCKHDKRVKVYIIIAGIQTAVLAISPIVLGRNAILYFIILSLEPLITYVGLGFLKGFKKDRRYIAFAVILLCIFTVSIQQ